MSKYRNLSQEEITQLEKQNCYAENWSNVEVVDGFNPGRIRSVNFSGNIKLGKFENEFVFPNIKKPSGVFYANLHNCVVGNNTYIAHIRNNLANYQIGENVFIENVDVIEVEGKTSFGNGIEINVLDETGGRKVPIYNEMSSHLAYILAMYRHRPKMVDAVNKMITDYSEKISSTEGIIQDNARILNSRIIRNVHIGDSCVIEGAEQLINGSLNSSSADPIYIGSGVIMRDFILSSGSHISDSAIVEHCFIGQSCQLGKDYSAEHSLFFSNCVGFHGEACSIFAGPYTVTHHKSTLLIAGMFSFLNAGSGSNQSNHMYKLGPIHQGIIERGSKTTSDSYLLWPAKVGPFSLVMGRHYKNSDTSELPFSYLIEKNDESILAPGVNLRSVGTIRDAQKWPKRDKRKDPKKLDHINFKLLSPFTIQKMIGGRNLLLKLQKYSGEKSEFYTYENVKIQRSSLERGIIMYNLGIYKFLGNTLMKRLEGIDFKADGEIRDRLKPDTDIGTGKWIDLAGLFTPMSVVDDLMQRIEEEEVNSLDEIKQAFEKMHKNYAMYEWTWAIDMLLKEAGKNITSIWAKDVIFLTEEWKKSVVELDKMLYNDAKKEFTLISQTGFGIDGDKSTQILDFEHVRGEFEKNPQVSDIKNHIEKKTALGDDLIKRMEKILNGD
ncbi:MAG: DUF4954 family protein [Bacteroidales bacterium]|nr:DUF4954 family protein [Bacteroidales bacterium]